MEHFTASTVIYFFAAVSKTEKKPKTQANKPHKPTQDIINFPVFPAAAYQEPEVSDGFPYSLANKTQPPSQLQSQKALHETGAKRSPKGEKKKVPRLRFGVFFFPPFFSGCENKGDVELLDAGGRRGGRAAKPCCEVGRKEK